MPTNTFGVLIHGAGWVSSQHAAAYRRNPAARVLAICTRSLESARKRVAEAELQDVTCYDDFKEALQHPGVDIVSICTPQHVHCENVVAAARAGKHLVIEKPVGLSVAELRRMRRAVREAGVSTIVSFVLRWNPLFHTIKTLIADGALGRVYSVEADYLSHCGSWWSGWDDTCSLDHGVSAMLVAGCHAVDALRWFASPGLYEAADPVEVYATAGGYRKGRREAYDPLRNTWVRAAPMQYDGLEVAVVKFANGVIGKTSVNFDCVMPYRFPLRIFGDRGTIMDNKLWSHKFPGQRDWIELPVVMPDSSDVAHHPFHAEIDHFIDCLQKGRPTHCDLEDAIKTHEVIFAALRSERTNRPVRLPLDRERGADA